MSSTTDWRPTCDLEMLAKRANLLRRIRLFFDARGVLEVDTPLLCQTTATDPYLESVFVASESRYLQTSPEFAMKRLVAAGSGPIFEITKAFRRAETGRRHNPEFTLLEWYRPGFDEFMLMDEVAELLRAAGYAGPATRCSYRALFRQHTGLDPFTVPTEQLIALAAGCSGLSSAEMEDRDLALDILLTHRIEPALKAEGAVFVYHYPPSQAALAQVAEVDGQPVARRFELYLDGMEVANGYFELTDGHLQRARFEADNERRNALGLPALPVDERLCQALIHGLPECAGVALGVDRLLMVLTGASTITDVLAFPWERA